MREDKPIRLIRACTEDTGILTSLLAWFVAEREKVKERLADATGDKIFKLQGEADCLRRLHAAIAQMTKEKGQVVDEQPRIRSVR